MLSEILIAVGAVLIVAGFLGLKMKTVGKRYLRIGRRQLSGCVPDRCSDSMSDVISQHL